jgi:multidrug efflux system outer membrane protein
MLGGCASAPPPTALGLPAVPQAYATRPDARAAGEAVAGAAAERLAATRDAVWWRVFADPALNALVERAMQANPDIEAAAARLAQARALLRGSDAARAPQASLSAGASRQGGPLVNAAGASGTLLTLGASASYEFDFFGRWAQAHAAATLDAQARASLLQAARLLVQADVAQAYFGLRGLDAEGRAAQAGVQAWRDTLRLTEQRWQAGSLPEQAVLRLRAELAGSQAEAAALQRRRAELQHALAVLLGEAASTFTLAEADNPADRVDREATAGSAAEPLASTPALPQVPAGLPSQMLARRPDVAAAQQAWAAAQARAGEARAAWWPSLALTASGGQASPGLADLLQAGTRAWGLGALLSLPVFDGGRREAHIQQADAATQAAHASYRSQMLLAFKDVEDQLTALSSLAEQAGWQAQAEAASARALVLAESRMRQGLASQLDLLDAQRSAMRSRRLRLQAQAAQAQGTVALIKALGGGWGAPGEV